MTTTTKNAPAIRADGSCTACGPGGHCAWHAAEGIRRDRERGAMLRSVAAGFRASEIARICARYELESDEFQTREEKAEAWYVAPA